MTVDQLLWILAIIFFIIAAIGTYLSRPIMIAFGWIGLAIGALTFLVS